MSELQPEARVWGPKPKATLIGGLFGAVKNEVAYQIARLNFELDVDPDSSLARPERASPEELRRWMEGFRDV